MNKKILKWVIGVSVLGLVGCGADLEEVARKDIERRNAEATADATTPDSPQETEVPKTEQPKETATTPDSPQETEVPKAEQPKEVDTNASENPLNTLLNELKDMTDDEYVSFVKNGTNMKYPDITWGEAFDNFFAEPSWRYFIGSKKATDENGDGVSDGEELNVDVVEFTGYCTYQEVTVKALLQFTLNMEESTFEPTYLSFNEVPQNNVTMYALVEKVLSEESSNSETKSQIEKALTNENDYKDLDAFVACMNSFSDPPEYEGEELQAYYKQQYDSWKNGTGFPEIVQDEDGNFIYNAPIDYYDAYAYIISSFEQDYGESTSYAIYDLDKDGKYELIISSGTCTADWTNEVFTVDEAEGTLHIGTFYGDTCLYATEDGNGLYSTYERMDAMHINLITKSEQQITDKVLDGTEVEFGEQISWMPAIDSYHLYDY